LAGNYSEEMQSIRIARVGLQNLPVDLLGLRQAPRLMVFQAGLYRLRDSDGRWYRSHLFLYHRPVSFSTTAMPGFIRYRAVLTFAFIARCNSTQKIRSDFRPSGLHGNPGKQALQVRMSNAFEDPGRE